MRFCKNVFYRGIRTFDRVEIPGSGGRLKRFLGI
jgi:glutaredoxin-related protein